MKRVRKTTGLALLFAAVLGVVASSYATPPRDDVFTFKLEPTVRPRCAGQVDMAFSFAPRDRFCEGWGCKELRVTVITDGGLEFLGEKSWTVQADKEHPYSTILHINVPRDDTCALKVRMQCCHITQTAVRYFVTIGDSIEYWKGNPRSYHPPPPPSKTTDPIRDTLTQEHLQAEYEVLLDLRDSTRRRIAEKILGPMPESSKSDLCDACHVLRVSLENLLKLVDEGLKFEFTTPPPWSRRYRAPNDSVPQPRPPPPPKPRNADDIDVDTLTPEQLQSEHEVILWFRDSTERKLVEQLVGPMQDSLRLHGRWGVFRVKMILEKFLEIRKHDVDVHLLKPHQWRHQAPQDSVPPPVPQDSVKPQGDVSSSTGEPAQTDGIVDAFLLFHELELVSYKPNAPSTFKLFYGPGAPCGDKVSATVSRWDYSQKFSEQTCELESLYRTKDGFSAYTATFQELIPDNDTTQLWITLECDTFAFTWKHFFVTTGDTVGYARGDPRKLRGHRTSSETNDPIRDTLTEEQLQTEYEVWLDLRDSTHLEIAEKILGPLPDSSKCEGYDGYYILKISLEKVLKLAEQGIELDTIRKKKSTRGIDSLQKRQLPTDSAKGQSASPTSPDGFSLDYIDGMTTPGILPTNEEITFYLRIYNNTPTNMEGMTNGFRIYSPDGAQWGSFSADTLNLGWEDMFDMWYSINHYSADGVGADTAGFTGISWDSLGGLPAFFDEVSYKRLCTIIPRKTSLFRNDLEEMLCLTILDLRKQFNAPGTWEQG